MWMKPQWRRPGVRIRNQAWKAVQEELASMSASSSDPGDRAGEEAYSFDAKSGTADADGD